MAYVSDHQQPLDGSMRLADPCLELCDGVDLLIHDAQYTAEEFAAKAHWGHCTSTTRCTSPAQAGARRLALFHHDPSHDDVMLDALAGRRPQPGARPVGVEVIAAYEGLTIAFGSAGARWPARRADAVATRPSRAVRVGR